jgi:hypothetical protein
MPDAPKEREQSTHERAYAVICLVSLLVVVVLMMLDGMGVWSVLPMLLGGVAFLLRWRSGPPLVLFFFLWMAPTRFHHASEPDPFLAWIVNWGGPGVNLRTRTVDESVLLEDVILCAALLSYTAACYRSLALSHSIFPPDFRRARISSDGIGRRRAVLQNRPTARDPFVPRTAELASPSEVPILFGVLGSSVLLALVFWVLSGFLPAELELSPVAWRNVSYFWAFVLVVSLCVAFFRYLGRCRAPKEENLLYLQDQLWLQTRHEQSALNRWLVWARLRWQRRQEKRGQDP